MVLVVHYAGPYHYYFSQDATTMAHGEIVTVRQESQSFSWQIALTDATAWMIAVPIAVVLRFDFALPSNLAESAIACGIGASSLSFVLAVLFRMYSGRYVTGTFDEVLGVVILTGFVSALGTLLLLTNVVDLPRATFIIAGGLSGLIMLGVRFLIRRTRTLRALGRDGNRTLIYGAGEAGSQLANLMQSDRSATFIPIGFLDDDTGKRHLRRSNLRVLGSGVNLGELIDLHAVETLVIAIAGVSSKRLQEIDRVCSARGVRVQVIPTAVELVGGAIRLGDVSDLSEEDIMGRQAIQTDEHQIAAFLRGKIILITGAGGSIGSEIARQVHRYSPKRVFLLDRDESALQEVQLSIDGSGLLMSEDLVLCDIRDKGRVQSLFNEIQPDVVFHAAALKHLAFLERAPSEAWKTNVLGTYNVVEAADATNVPHFVNISTDKAADPSSVLGRSKLITEQIISAHNTSDTSWVSVRFGNVLGSRGSVVTTFRYQIAKGGPITVTDPDVSRYFMTIREAVHLVLQAAVLGENGQTLILDMGEPVKIVDIARYMVQRSGRNIPITFAGLRPGEKLDEVLVAIDEHLDTTEHPLITRTRVSAFNDFSSLDALDWENACQKFLQSHKPINLLALGK